MGPQPEGCDVLLLPAGFDVWLANQRGNTYSRRSVNNLYPYQPEFWYFSLDTLAQLDLPTQVDYVLQAAGVSKIAYLGHSQVRTSKGD
jgi:lysosomal acid lipase/cholesteryl ester hydrolase